MKRGFPSPPNQSYRWLCCFFDCPVVAITVQPEQLANMDRCVTQSGPLHGRVVNARTTACPTISKPSVEHARCV
jgi:hypothetical protein